MQSVIWLLLSLSRHTASNQHQQQPTLFTTSSLCIKCTFSGSYKSAKVEDEEKMKKETTTTECKAFFSPLVDAAIFASLFFPFAWQHICLSTVLHYTIPPAGASTINRLVVCHMHLMTSIRKTLASKICKKRGEERTKKWRQTEAPPATVDWAKWSRREWGGTVTQQANNNKKEVKYTQRRKKTRCMSSHFAGVVASARWWWWWWYYCRCCNKIEWVNKLETDLNISTLIVLVLWNVFVPLFNIELI